MEDLLEKGMEETGWRLEDIKVWESWGEKDGVIRFKLDPGSHLQNQSRLRSALFSQAAQAEAGGGGGDRKGQNGCEENLAGSQRSLPCWGDKGRG